ncbi:MerR family transcriptional regulator [Danxiaibacter flavus]|uniref:MerR family transcriptional regulator n=1 Tax=Danxiaibacter flavus TaxID=3049108 RepID=A0ABV3ZFJ2_9BACT|nr:MerR family transcriptional regulator [Chitinophagaceae bacterium DXS]
MATQLDLFGMFDAPVQEEKKNTEQVIAPATTVPEEILVEETAAEEPVLPLEEILPLEKAILEASAPVPEKKEEPVIATENTSAVVFADHKIAVKIKLKPRPVEAVVETVVAQENDTKVVPETNTTAIPPAEIAPIDAEMVSDKIINEAILVEQETTANLEVQTDEILGANNTKEEKEPDALLEKEIVVIDDLFSAHPAALKKDEPKADTKKYVQTELPVVKKRGRKSFKEIDAEVSLVSVPDDEELFQKQYYAISQVAKWFNVNTSLLRYWENEFDVLKPRKNRKGDRLFRPEDIKNLQVIYYLLRQRKFSIEGAKKYLKENKKSADTNIQLIQSLTKLKGFLLELKANLGS